VVSHDITNALATADRLAVMHEGREIFVGTADELRRSPHPIIDAFLTSSHQRERRTAEPRR
jgi:ABC-type transporter Mla maintaining outer membrane lipid asymmetry ATPase subunit MlaF